MKKLSIGLSAVALLATLAMPSLADTLRGRIKTVDADKGIVTLLEGQKDYVFTVGADSKLLTVAGTPLANGLKSGDLKEGRRVTVEYSIKDGVNTLESLQLRK